MSTQYYWTCDACNQYAWGKCSHGGIAGPDSKEYVAFVKKHSGGYCKGDIKIRDEHSIDWDQYHAAFWNGK